MKKFILAAALVAAMAPAAVAQDEFAPEKGDFGVELQFNPFSNDYTTFRDSEYGLTGRYFITNKDAIRLNIGFGVHKDIDNTDFETSENNYVTLTTTPVAATSTSTSATSVTSLPKVVLTYMQAHR